MTKPVSILTDAEIKSEMEVIQYWIGRTATKKDSDRYISLYDEKQRRIREWLAANS